MTDSAVRDTHHRMNSAISLPAPHAREVLDLERVYRDHVDYVVRAARGFGVAPSLVDDVVQDVFVAVHGKLSTFEGRSTLRTWITGILIRVALTHRRRTKRDVFMDAVDESIEASDVGADERIARMQAETLVSRLLDTLDDDKRIVFVLAEIEEVPVTEIAEALNIPLNTAYSRLRLARKDFESAAKQLRAKDEWRLR